MKILFLVHVEEMFRDFFPKMYVPRICKAMHDYDRVYVFCSEVMDTYPIIEVERTGVYFKQIQWGWGYEEDMFSEDENKWVIPANGHEYTWVPDELREPADWEHDEISVGGGCREECLQDFRDVLEHMEIPYRLVRGLTY